MLTALRPGGGGGGGKSDDLTSSIGFPIVNCAGGKATSLYMYRDMEILRPNTSASVATDRMEANRCRFFCSLNIKATCLAAIKFWNKSSVIFFQGTMIDHLTPAGYTYACGINNW